MGRFCVHLSNSELIPERWHQNQLSTENIRVMRLFFPLMGMDIGSHTWCNNLSKVNYLLKLRECCLTLWVTPAFCACLLFLLFHYCHTLIPSYPCNLLQLHNAQYSFMSIYKFLFILISTRESKSNDLSARVISGIALSALEYCIPVLYMTGLHPSVTQ